MRTGGRAESRTGAPRWCGRCGPAVALLIALSATLAASCTAVAGTPGTSAGPPPSPTTASSSVAPGDPAPTTAAPPTTAGPISVPGIIRRGAAPGCWVLFADDGRHFVLLDAPNPPPNVPVLVHGVAEPSELSRCNGGTVLHTQGVDLR